MNKRKKRYNILVCSQYFTIIVGNFEYNSVDLIYLLNHSYILSLEMNE